ncbi:MAG: glycosyltransferase [Gammaproteobacteria bacterium]|nr:glycosyltransferase [Gammaproteobacteria bacterium]
MTISPCKLEILIPSFNRPQKLYHLLTTGIDLAIPNTRFVVLDDGSTKYEQVADFGMLSTEEVCQHFDSKVVRYIRSESNLGLPAMLKKYYQNNCHAKYTLLVNDKDEFINAEPIKRAMLKLDNDANISVVQIPLRQHDIEADDRPLLFNYSRMAGSEYIEQYISDTNLQHCGGYGIYRVSAVRKVAVPRPLNLRGYGLEDAFGFDIDYLMMVATTGDVDFESEAHIRRSIVGGLTEKYPLTFAYCYYQYAKRIMRELLAANFIKELTAKKYIAWWILLMLRGLVVVYQPSPSREEVDTSRIQTHLQMPILIYLLKQLIVYRIWPNKEMQKLFEIYLAARHPGAFSFLSVIKKIGNKAKRVFA